MVGRSGDCGKKNIYFQKQNIMYLYIYKSEEIVKKKPPVMEKMIIYYNISRDFVRDEEKGNEH